jgi:regulator of sigma E protease
MDNIPIVFQYLLAILGFSIIILVHEYGHYIFSKLCGIHVLEFFIGFGPKLLKYKSKRSGTMYGISAVPLGGYNRILGMTREEKVPEGMQDRVFYSKPYYKKFMVISGGGLFNIILTVICIMIYLSMGVFTPVNTVDYVQPDSPAELSGFQVGDEVVALNGEEIGSWEEFVFLTKERPGESVTYRIIRDGEKMDLRVTLDVVDNTGYLGVGPKAEKIRLGFFEVIKEGFKMTGELFVAYVKLFGMLLSGKIPFSEARPASPIGVISIIQQSVAMGFQNFILFLGLISLLLAFGNFLPILPVDGGHLVIITLEAIRKRPVPKKAIEVYTTLGLVFIVSLLLIGFIFDIISPFRLPNM